MNIPFRKPAAIMLLGIVAASGCTWVDPIAGASAVTLVQPSHVVNCQSIGTTISQVANKIGFVNRSDDKVTEELLTLAKNSAVEMGGDTLVAEGGPSEGTQKFRIYKCQ
ncbi:MAG: DUF4156 domain-containing protein [Halioglobus sp.]|nr:DUF4156 domain-containing protein [Halioglobus sp.]